MLEVSELYRRIIAQPHHVESRLRIAGTDYDRESIVSAAVELDMFKEECPSVGNVCSGYISVEMLSPAAEIPVTSKMELYSRVVSEVDGAASEWLSRGVYWLDTRKHELTDSGQRATVSLTGYDAMLKTELTYSPTGAWPKTDKDVLDEICTLLGIPCDEQLGGGYSIPEPSDYTCRELLGYIAASYGANWTIAEDGKLTLVPLGSSRGNVSLLAQRVTVGDALSAITQVILHKMDGNQFLAGPPGRALNVDCPWATQEMAEAILEQVQGYQYRPFSAENAILEPAFQICDGCGLGLIYGYRAELFSGITADLEAPPEEEIAHNYPYPSGGGGGGAGGVAGRALAAARKKTEEIKSLVADVGVAQAGIKASVKYVDLEDSKWIDAHTTIFADAAGKRSAFDLWVEGTTDGEMTSAAKLVADVITLKAAVEDAFTELELKADSDTVTELDGKVTTILTAQADLTTRVGQAEAALKLKAEQSTVEELDGSLKTLYTGVSNLSTRVGNAESSLTQKVSSTEFNDTVAAYDEAFAQVQESVTSLTSRVGSAEASLELKADSDTVTGISTSVATLSADVIELQGRVDLTGSLAVTDGTIEAARAIIGKANIRANGGLSSTSLELDTDSFTMARKKYGPQSITSTTGAVLALGA